MPGESDYFICPCCGMHAPQERLEEDLFELEAFHKTLGGKNKLTAEDRELRKGTKYRPGQAPGRLNYTREEVTPELIDKVRERIKELHAEFSG